MCPAAISSPRSGAPADDAAPETVIFDRFDQGGYVFLIDRIDRTIALNIKNFIRIQDEQTEAFLEARQEQRYICLLKYLKQEEYL